MIPINLSRKVLLTAILVVVGTCFISDACFLKQYRVALAQDYLIDPLEVDSLVRALKDTRAYVRRSAAWRLGNLQDDSATVPLITALKDEKDKSVRWNIADALHKITSQDFGDNYQDWLDWFNAQKK